MNQIKRFLKRFALIRIILEKRNSIILEKRYFNRKKNIAKTLESGSLVEMLGQEERDYWMPRIKLVQESTDNNKINHVPNTATFNKDYNLVLHNGILIDPLSYYGLPVLEMLFKNKGIHEPEEEYAFQEVLKGIPDSAVMIELGSYWSFYSMWFNSIIKEAKNYMIEPEFMDSGIKNFEINNMNGDFTKAFISDCSEKSKIDAGIPMICIDDFVDEKNIEFVDILHSDIQGYEFKMLVGAEKLLDKKNVGYIFISTHSMELHSQCSEHLRSKGYLLVCSSDLDESYSWDGLLVFKNPDYHGLEAIDISKRKIKKKGIQ